MRPPEFTFAHLLHELEPISGATLALMLGALVQEGAVRQLVRLQSRLGSAGIKDYSSVLDVPGEIDDPFSGTTFEVSPDDLQVIYRFNGA